MLLDNKEVFMDWFVNQLETVYHPMLFAVHIKSKNRNNDVALELCYLIKDKNKFQDLDVYIRGRSA